METLKKLLGEEKARKRNKTESDLYGVIDNLQKNNKLDILYDNDIVKYTSRVKGLDDVLCIEIISKYLFENKIFYYDKNKNSNYSRGERIKIRDEIKNKDFFDYINELSYGIGKKNMMEDRICQCMFSQEKVSDCNVIDFQIPLINGGSNNIDIMFVRNDKCHICEAKKFGSPETLLRCILEIETYYQQIDWQNFDKEYGFDKNHVAKTILIPKDSEAYKEYVLMMGGHLPYLGALFKQFNITLYSFDLDRKNNKFIIMEEQNG